MSLENIAQSASASNGTWNSWLQRAKNMTVHALDFVKSDLEEFGTALTEQTTSTVTTIKNHVPNMDSSWVKSLMESVNDFLNLEDDANCDNDKLNIPKVCPNELKKSGSRLFAMQSDPGTYCDEPRGSPDLFEDWLDHFNLKDKKDDIGHLLRFNPLVRQFYADHVPERISNSIFWQRYFYKLHQLELDESRRKTLKNIQKDRAVIKRQLFQHKESWNSSNEKHYHGETIEWA